MPFRILIKDMKNLVLEIRYNNCRFRSLLCSNILVQALRMVEDETKRYRPTKNYLEYFPTPTHTYEVAKT